MMACFEGVFHLQFMCKLFKTNKRHYVMQPRFRFFLTNLLKRPSQLSNKKTRFVKFPSPHVILGSNLLSVIAITLRKRGFERTHFGRFVYEFAALKHSNGG